MANSNCGKSLGFKPVHKLKARWLVDLPDFAAWAVKRNLPNLPPELVAMAATKPTASPDTASPEQPDCQKTPEYQAEYAKAWQSLDAVDDIDKAIKVWEAASAPTVGDLKEKERTIAALKAKRDALMASVFPIESQQPAPAQSTVTTAPVETIAQRRARYLELFEAEEKRGKHGALARLAKREGVDRSNMGKDIEKARTARAELKRAGAFNSQLVQAGKRQY